MKRKADFLVIIGKLAYLFGVLFLINLFLGLFFFGIFYWFLFVCILLVSLLIAFFAAKRILINSLKNYKQRTVIDVEAKMLPEDGDKRKHENIDR